jgi:hypothetical protein
LRNYIADSNCIMSPQPSRRAFPASPVGAVYSSIIRSAHRTESRNTEETKARQRMAIKTPHFNHHHHNTHPTASPSTASLTEEAVFYHPTSRPSSAQHSSPEDLDDESVDHRGRSVRKRDKVKMVGHNLHTAFRSWFKDVSCLSAWKV